MRKQRLLPGDLVLFRPGHNHVWRGLVTDQFWAPLIMDGQTGPLTTPLGTPVLVVHVRDNGGHPIAWVLVGDAAGYAWAGDLILIAG